jgi:predicted neuraminidase
MVSDLTEPVQTTLRNPHSGIDIQVDQKDSIVIAYNDSHRNRTPLTLGVSGDRGVTWRCRDIEIEPGEYSYPKLLQTENGNWHVFYTWRRQCIAHVEFDMDWLVSGRPVYGMEPEGGRP